MHSACRAPIAMKDMTTQQLSCALQWAKDSSFNALAIDIGMFEGFALASFTPIVCTLEQLAALIRWQCLTFAGNIDHEALQEIASAGRRKFTVL